MTHAQAFQLPKLDPELAATWPLDKKTIYFTYTQSNHFDGKLIGEIIVQKRFSR